MSTKLFPTSGSTTHSLRATHGLLRIFARCQPSWIFIISRHRWIDVLSLDHSSFFVLALPLVILLLAGTFTVGWLASRRSRDLAWAGAAYAVLGLGLCLQLLRERSGELSYAMAAIYLVGVALLSHSLSLRFRVKYDWGKACALVLLTVSVRYYFEIVSFNHSARIYALNFGLGSVLLLPAWRLARVRTVSYLDRSLLWIFGCLGLSFFLRTILTVPWPWEPLDTARFERRLFWLVMQMSMLLFAVLFAMLWLAAAVRDLVVGLKWERNHDALTQLLNRRGFEENAATWQRRGEGCSAVLMCDIDWFKSINDQHGHAAGDEILRLVGQALRGSVRQGDLVARLGGEEFAALLRVKDASDAMTVAERLRAQLRASALPVRGQRISVTMSLGATQWYMHEPLTQALERADGLLYQAKTAGRNRVVSDIREPGSRLDRA